LAGKNPLKPRLAQAVGSYAERPAHLSLAGHFSAVWVHRVPPDHDQAVTIVPDGCVDLQWIDGSLRLAGPDREAVAEPLTPGATVIGFRFAPGAAASWLGIPLHELVNTRMSLDLLPGQMVRRIRDACQAAASAGDAARLIERELIRHLSCVPPPDVASIALFDGLGIAAEEGIRLSGIAKRLDMNARTLRRHAHRAFGYGPKTLARILRLQRFMQEARSGQPIASLAYRAGYADQAHLTREMQRMIGMTPAEILSQLRA
jgi:AraC-like DNA-binding protein